MSRWIDAEKELKELKDMKIEGEVFTTAVNFAITVIEEAPSIDIVRCKECKYAEVSVSPITGLWCTRFGINDMAMEDDDFCSYGERNE